MNWKYGLISIQHETVDDDYCELVEIYMDEEGSPTAFCKARINSLDELSMAFADVTKDGVNYHFRLNGTFEVDTEDGGWEWTANSSDEQDEELYAVYGGD